MCFCSSFCCLCPCCCAAAPGHSQNMSAMYPACTNRLGHRGACVLRRRMDAKWWITARNHSWCVSKVSVVGSGSQAHPQFFWSVRELLPLGLTSTEIHVEVSPLEEHPLRLSRSSRADGSGVNTAVSTAVVVTASFIARPASFTQPTNQPTNQSFTQ